MATEPTSIAATNTTATTTAGVTPTPPEKQKTSIFDVPANFFDGCRLLSPSAISVFDTLGKYENPPLTETPEDADTKEETGSKNGAAVPRWTCNNCKAEFESLQDQRSHFKSDIHRINVKLIIAGKDIVKEEDFDELTSDSFKDCDISSISGSEDEADKASFPCNDTQKGLIGRKQKLFFRLKTGERVSIWKCLLLNESESVSCENGETANNGGFLLCLKETEVIERLKFLIHEPRDNKHLRTVLLASGGHFAGCVFDGNSIVAHKTFHRYVVRAKAGKKQSSKDASGRAAHSAGASLRRHNELALKKDIQELLAAWKPYFDASSRIFIHAPSSSRMLLFDGDKAYFSHQHCAVRNVPLTVRRPTLKEARHVYSQLTQVAYEVDEKENLPDTKEDSLLSTSTISDSWPKATKVDFEDSFNSRYTEVSSSHKKSDELVMSREDDNEVVGITTALHDAAKSDDSQKVLELLEEGLDPCIKDERGRTPYMLANEKEVRNTFRRFMALNLDRWDWHAAKVPSALTKEMEESQAAKQAEKDAKKKARAKELKKLRKAREKKAQAEASVSQNATIVVEKIPQSSQSLAVRSQISKEEQQKRAQAIEREKRAAAAERRIAAATALNTQGSSSTSAPINAPPKSGLATDICCSCCNASLAGKIPFHRYNYKYCSTSCMHVHKEFLEDE